MTKRGLLLWVLATTVFLSALPTWAANPTTGPKAGSITALLPVAKITRGSGKQAVTTEAKKGDALIWNDLIKTEKGGRARITLADQSILSLGSQAELRIVKHDARSQQTALEMAYGRVRAQVASITRDGGSFELRTPTAVAGVIGTDFGVDSSSVGGDTFVCLAGVVQVANSNKSVAGSVQCAAGQTTTVQPGKPPSPPKPASVQQLQQLIQDTEPAVIASINPAAALPGNSFTTNIAGQNMSLINSASMSGSGVTATFKSATASGVQVQITIAADAAAGPRTLTLSKAQGPGTAAVFTVLGSPGGTDPKAADLQTLQQLTQTGIAGLGGFLTGAQQTADQVAQQVTNANLNLTKPIDLTPFATALNQQYGTVQSAQQTQNTAIQTASQNAATQFQAAYDAAHQALLQRSPGGTPDSTFTTAVSNAFQAATNTLQAAITTSQNLLNTTVQTYATNIDQLQQNWIQQINAAAVAQLGGPTPKLNTLDTQVELGSVAVLDATGSQGGPGASILSTSWVLCGPSYQPSSFGVALPATTTACNSMQGFASTQSEFDIATCSLNPGTYFARLTLTDSNNKVTPIDVRLVVNAPLYGTPGQTVRSLASAYSSLLYSPMAAFFDPSAPGIAAYLNNLQNTLQTLNSMNILIVSSQDTTNCNDAVTRATWQQNYSFKNSPSTVLTQNEQLTVAMHRTPGVGWLVTNMIGDNGTVQGTLPGPFVSNQALPKTVISNSTLGGNTLSTTTPTAFTPGTQTITVTVGNVGNADLTVGMPVTISIVNSANSTVATSTQTIAAISQNGTATVTASLSVPAMADNTSLSLVVNVNPGCQIPEKSCDANNTQTYPLVVQNHPDLQFGPLTFPPVLQMGSTGPTTVTVMNTGGSAPAGWDLVITINGTQAGTAIGPAIPAGQSVSVPITINVPQVGTPPQNLPGVPVVLTLNSNNAIVESNTANNTISAPGGVILQDFTLATVPTAAQTGVVGRTFSLTALSLNPASYGLPLTVAYSGLPAGLVGNNLQITGSPSAAGSATVTGSGTGAGVTHAATGSLAINVLGEIALTQPSVPTLVSGGTAQTLTVAETGGLYPVTLCATMPTGITTTSGTINGNVSCQTISGPGNLTWDLTAGVASSTGTLVFPVLATDAGFPAGQGTVTPSANLTLQNIQIIVNGTANYQVTPVTVTGHSSPYIGANALQVGENVQVQATVANIGNASPNGTLTVSFTCGNPQVCSTPLTASVTAPAAGTSTIATLSLPSLPLPVASYSGSISLSTTMTGVNLGPNFSLPFDVVDFSISPVTMPPAQNLPIGGSGMVSVSMVENLPQGSPFAIPVTPSSVSTVTFTPATQNGPGANIAFAANAGSGTPPSPSGAPDSITFSATNHSVTKTAVVPVNYFTAQITPLSILVNNSSNPLTVPIAVGGTPPTNYPNLNMQMTGNYLGGTAALTVTNPTCATLATTPTPLTVSPGDSISWPLYATGSSTCTGATPVVIQAAIPNTNPTLTLPVYTLYIVPSGLAQLQISSTQPPTSSRTINANAPWLSGEPIDWQVVVKNAGSGASTGGEAVQVFFNNAQIGQGTLSGAIAANGTQTVTVHTVAPDVDAGAPFGPTASLRFHVVPDNQGDLAPGTGDQYLAPNISNWSLSVSGAGSTDASPVTLTVGGTISGTASVGVNFGAGPVSLPLVVGTYSSGQLAVPGMSPNTVSPGAPSTVTVAIQNGGSPVAGYYYAQVIAQMKDGATVTTQRQATIHIQVANSSAGNPAPIVLTSDQNNVASCPGGQCGTAPAVAQINGPLPNALNLSASMQYCSAGPCTGNIDISFTDGFATTTSPQITTIPVTYPNSSTMAVRVKAADNPDGTVNTGPAYVVASVSGIQAQWVSSVRQPTPSPVGNNQYQLAYNIGDIVINTSSCVAVPPQGTTAVQLSVSMTPVSGFNVPNIAWEWEDSNHIQVSGSPLTFGTNTGTVSYSGGNYSSLPTFSLSNQSTTGLDGLQSYYFAITVTNGLATATKYFPIQVDLSQSQTFCPLPNIVRGPSAKIAGPRMTSRQTIRGSWSRAALIGGGAHAAISVAALPDLRISATDVSYTPSMPKTGDTVSVRFKVSNVGNVDAKSVPIALKVNGNLVASDKFDVPAGKSTLGGLVWNNAQAPGTAAHPALATGPGNLRYAPPAAPLMNLQAMLVIDPNQTIRQQTALSKSVPLAHLSLHGGTAASVAAASAPAQRAQLLLSEGGCAGLHFGGGTGGCGGNADVTLSVDDLARGVYRLEARNGIADIGMGRPVGAGTRYSFSPQATAQAGHTYAVQLPNGSVGFVTVRSVSSPGQTNRAAQQVFRGPAARTITKLGSHTAPQDPQTVKVVQVSFDILYQGQ